MAEIDEFLAQMESAREHIARELFHRNRITRWKGTTLARSTDGLLIRLLFSQLCNSRQLPVKVLRERCMGLPLSSGFLADILRALPHLPSHVAPSEVLGLVYERFLANTISFTQPGPRFQLSPEARKTDGVYYTPGYIVDYIVDETVGTVAAKKSSEEILKLRILDPACGDGRFLVRAFDSLLLPFASAKIAKEIFLNCIHGIDLDPQAVEVTRLSLCLKLLEYAPSAVTPSTIEQLLADLSQNIRCGDSLLAAQPAERPAPPYRQRRAIRVGHPSFDVVLGNPPYGARLRTPTRARLARLFDVGTTDTAALMMVQARRQLTRSGGLNGFIVPKAFTYSSTWKRVRSELLPELTTLVDVGKVWPEVKLEQVIYIAQKDGTGKTYKNFRRAGAIFQELGAVDKEHCRSFGFLLNGISRAELEVGIKIKRAGTFLGDYVRNSRGAMCQNQVSDTAKGRRVIGGKQIQRFHIAGEKGFVASKLRLDSNAFVSPGSILVQNIIAHIENPIDHIKITAAVVDEDVARRTVILDTVNQLTNYSTLSPYFFAAILNSRLMNWYVYRLIYARAIRTMHFDGPVTSRIPVPRITGANRRFYEEVVAVAETLSGARSVDSLSDAGTTIESALHRLYKLTTDDIVIVESGMPSTFLPRAAAATQR